jgi:hypothetical protein
LSRGQDLIGLLPRIPCRHEQHPVQPSLGQCGLAGVEMGEMNRVKGPAEYACAHFDEDRALVVSPDARHG